MTLLNDDEIVAIVAKEGLSWPAPLPTVALDESALILAALRGVRSLVSRELATMEGINYSVDASLVEIVRLVATSNHASTVYVAESTSPGEASGSAMYLYTAGPAAVLDLVALNGTHDLAAVSLVDGAILLAAFGGNVFSTGIEAESGSEPALFVRSSTELDRAFRITQGALCDGTITGAGSVARFTVSTTSTAWEESGLRELISGKA